MNHFLIWWNCIRKLAASIRRLLLWLFGSHFTLFTFLFKQPWHDVTGLMHKLWNVCDQPSGKCLWPSSDYAKCMALAVPFTDGTDSEEACIEDWLQDCPARGFRHWGISRRSVSEPTTLSCVSSLFEWRLGRRAFNHLLYPFASGSLLQTHFGDRVAWTVLTKRIFAKWPSCFVGLLT